MTNLPWYWHIHVWYIDLDLQFINISHVAAWVSLVKQNCQNRQQMFWFLLSSFTSILKRWVLLFVSLYGSTTISVQHIEHWRLVFWWPRSKEWLLGNLSLDTIFTGTVLGSGEKTRRYCRRATEMIFNAIVFRTVRGGKRVSWRPSTLDQMLRSACTGRDARRVTLFRLDKNCPEWVYDYVTGGGS